MSIVLNPADLVVIDWNSAARILSPSGRSPSVAGLLNSAMNIYSPPPNSAIRLE